MPWSSHGIELPSAVAHSLSALGGESLGLLGILDDVPLFRIDKGRTSAMDARCFEDLGTVIVSRHALQFVSDARFWLWPIHRLSVIPDSAGETVVVEALDGVGLRRFSLGADKDTAHYFHTLISVARRGVNAPLVAALTELSAKIGSGERTADDLHQPGNEREGRP